MAYYLGFDGGGTKSCAVLFDEHGPLGYGRSGGTNTNFTTVEDCRRNIEDCLRQTLQGYPDVEIEAFYFVIVGPGDILVDVLESMAAVKRIVPLGEGQAGILAGALRRTGLVALAGTGSDAFYLGENGAHGVVGALGSILGDDGGGAWIGQQALRRGIAWGEGWGEKTILLDLVLERWNLTDKWDLARHIYQSPAPFRQVAAAVPIVAEAARKGDAVALSIFEEAGRLMGVQMRALVRREQVPPKERLCVCCGGAWKAHPLMYEAFRAYMGQELPDVQVCKPLYEHLMAGVVMRAQEERPDLPPQELDALLRGPYADYRIQW